MHSFLPPQFWDCRFILPHAAFFPMGNGALNSGFRPAQQASHWLSRPPTPGFNNALICLCILYPMIWNSYCCEDIKTVIISILTNSERVSSLSWEVAVGHRWIHVNGFWRSTMMGKEVVWRLIWKASHRVGDSKENAFHPGVTNGWLEQY